MIGRRETWIGWLAIALVAASGLTLVPARAAAPGGVDACWQVYARKVAEADQLYRNPGSGGGGSSNVGAWHDAWTAAADDLLECLLGRLGGRLAVDVRFAHAPGLTGLPHAASWTVENPEGAATARAWLFAAPLAGGEGAGVPRVTVNGRVAFDGAGEAASGPRSVEVPLLPGANEVEVRCEPGAPVAAILVLEFPD